MRQSYEGYTKKQVQGVILARKYSVLIRHPSERDLKYLVSSQNLYECPLTIYDVKNAHAVFGTYIVGVRGGGVGKKTDRVVTDYVSVPRKFLVLYKYVTLVADVCFVGNGAFLVTMSRGIKFVTV